MAGWKQCLGAAAALTSLIPALVAAHGGEDHGTSTDSRSSLNTNKGGAIAAFLVVSFVSTMVPFFIPISKRFIVYGSLFAAGLFLSLGLEHLLHDAVDGFAEVLPNSTYPLAYSMVLVGFFAAFLAEIIATAILNKDASKPSPLERFTLPESSLLPGASVSTSKRVGDERTEIQMEEHVCGCGDACACPAGKCRCPSDVETIAPTAIAIQEIPDFVPPSKLMDLTIIDATMLTVALCFHSVFEGLAVGLQGSVSNIWSTAGPLLVHKFFEGAALGVTVLATQANRSFLNLSLFAAGFAIMVPVGVAVGMIVDSTTTGEGRIWAESFANTIACGVLIFVALSHVMAKAMRQVCIDSMWEPFYKFSSMFLGSVVMSMLQFWD